MDVILPTNYRPERLNSTLSSLLLQDLNDQRTLHLVDNSRQGVVCDKQISKLLVAFRRTGWKVDYVRTQLKTISRLKLQALSLGTDACITLLDNDIVFTRADTLKSLLTVLENYDVACVSPLAYDVDSERPILNGFAYMYDSVASDENGVSEGNIALGPCLCMWREDFEAVKPQWCPDLPYMEDQVLVHFLKKRRGYAFLKTHMVLHFSYAEKPTYRFDNREVLAYLESKLMTDPTLKDLRDLRSNGRDGADFPRRVMRKWRG